MAERAGPAAVAAAAAGPREVCYNDQYSEYYYVDQKGDYQTCDRSGNPIYATDRTGNQTNRYGLDVTRPSHK